MTVKTVFSTLIGTIVLSCVLMLLIEYLNITASSTFMKGILTNSIESSCDYYAQETYKEANTGGGGSILSSGNAEDLKDWEGRTAISGAFFKGSGKEQVYENLYGNGSPFEQWYRKSGGAYDGGGGSINIKGTWKNLDMLASGLGINSAALTTSEKEMGKSYAETMMTPLNLGIPYLDEETVERICRYNIVANMSEGRRSAAGGLTNVVTNPESRNIYDSVRSDGNANTVQRVNYTTGQVESPPYVQYRGFRVYYDSFNITNMKYTVYDLTDASERKKFEEVTNIYADNLYAGFINSMTDDERALVGVIKIDYELDVDYSGMTPMSRVLNYASNINVDGIDKSIQNTSAGRDIVGGANRFSNSQAVPVSDSIYYYIVR